MSKLFLGGVPTDIEVRLLNEEFGQPEEGQEITHEDVEKTVKLNRKTSRYRAVTLAWRRALLEEHNIQLGAVPSVGFRCLNNSHVPSTSVQQ